MAKVITVTNQKGGVGKTTGSVHIALALQEAGHRVLFLDHDTQSHSTFFLTGDMSLKKRANGAEKTFDKPADLKPIITASGIHLLHGHEHLGSLEAEGKTTPDAIAVTSYVRSLPYDFIVIDTPPALGLMQLSAMIWADILVVITDPGIYSMTGVASVKGVVDVLQVNNLLAENFRFRVLFNKFDARSSTDLAVQATFRRMYGDAVIDQTLPFSDAFKTVEATRQPLWALTYMPKRTRLLFQSLPTLIGAVAVEE